MLRNWCVQIVISISSDEINQVGIAWIYGRIEQILKKLNFQNDFFTLFFSLIILVYSSYRLLTTVMITIISLNICLM